MILVKQLNVFVRDTLNYQNKCKNPFRCLVGLSNKVAKLHILICRDVYAIFRDCSIRELWGNMAVRP